MKQSKLRFVSLGSAVLVAVSAFAACGGLDDRKITRDESSTGGDGTGNTTSSGGSQSNAGEPNVNPFGGDVGDGGAPVIVDGPPTVTMVDPADAATDVDVEANVSFKFSEAVIESTITDESVQLLDGTTAVAGKATAISNQVATFEPTRRLSLATKYTASVSTAVTDTTNQGLASAFTSTFTTRDGVWDVDLGVVEDSAEWDYYSYANVGVDALGNALVAYSSGSAIWGRWYRLSSGWQDPILLSAEGHYIYSDHAVTVSDEGDAIVVWSEYNQELQGTEVLARRYIGGSWSAAPEPASGTVKIDSINRGDGPFVAMRGGQIVVWWTHNVYITPNSYFYLYATSTTPDAPFPPDPVNMGGYNGASNYFGRTALSMDSVGNAMLVHNLTNTATSVGELFFSKFVAATENWESPAPISGASDVNSYAPFSVALDDAGVAVAVWHDNTAPHDLFASRYTKAKGFSTPVPLDELDTEPESALQGGVVSDGTDFIVSWAQTVGSTRNAYSTRYSTASATWSPAELISDGDTGVQGTPTGTADRHGNAMILWVQDSAEPGPDEDSSKQFSFARWRSDQAAWQPAEIVTNGKNFDSHYFSVATAGNGVALVCYQDDGNRSGDRPGQGFLNVFQ